MSDKPAKQNSSVDLQGSDMTPNQLLQEAVQGNADVEVMERLMSLQERYENRNAKKAFDHAMSDLRSNLPDIIKDQHVSHKGGSYSYEQLSDVTEALSPVMSERGLSFRWRTNTHTEKSPTTIEVTCIISHEDGHYEETTLEAPIDSSGSKNPIQGVGSAVTYLQRYTLKAAVGVAAKKDDDAQAVSGSKTTPSTANEGPETKPCPVHDGSMLKKRSNDDGEWWSHKLGDDHEDDWCNATPESEQDDKSGSGDNGEERPDWADEWLDRSISQIKDGYAQDKVTLDGIIDRERQLPEDEQRKTLLDWANAQIDKQEADTEPHDPEEAQSLA